MSASVVALQTYTNSTSIYIYNNNTNSNILCGSRALCGLSLSLARICFGYRRATFQSRALVGCNATTLGPLQSVGQLGRVDQFAARLSAGNVETSGGYEAGSHFRLRASLSNASTNSSSTCSTTSIGNAHELISRD